ncbi:MAG: TonB-dependent receptor [Bryobacteraceae bacterium]|nr:carboxypeptidase regulatory-like domain-containing protein [Bryobacterales bacterium]NUN03374.1 TonB-dependent receptor [Bryobacteraceae bacterium]
MLTSIRFLMIAVAFCTVVAHAQTATGNIMGRVTDSTGAVVTSVEVTALNPATGVTSRTVTDETGLYRFFYLAPATYNLTFTKPGFSTLQRTAIVLRSNDTLTVDVQLAVGNVVEQVEVTGTTPLLETATATTGTVLAGRQMNALPIMQRYTWMTMYLMPGVTSMNGFHIAGQRDRGIGYSMDGIPGTEPVRGGVATNRIMSTTQNAIEEIKIVTTVMPADQGHSAGGMLSATYKSGTNQLHFEGEDRYINDQLLHRAYFNLERSNNPLKYHELSALVSGPVYLPKLYDGRNKTFFLFGWSRHHEKYDQQLFATVPTREMLNGDFSFGGIGLPIYDPATTRQDASGTWVRDPFPGNVIPRNRFDPAVEKFLSNNPWNAPNNLGGSGLITRFGPDLNYGGTSKYRSYRSRYDVKIDQHFSEKNRLFGRFSHVKNRARGTNIALNWELLDGGFVLQPSDQINMVVSDTHMFSPSVINEIRLGANRRKESRTPPGVNENWGQKLGIPGISGETFPSFFNSSGSAFYGATMPGADFYQVTENFVLQDNLTVVRGRHSFKTGYELMRTRANTRAASLPAGVYRFGGTNLPFTPNTGNDFAAFLLGSVVRADFNTALANWLPRWWSHAFYLQDDFTVSPRLTLNAGVRWSYESPFNTKYGQHSQFDPTATDPLTGGMGAITHPGNALANNDFNNFQPRLGAAFRISDKMVLRGGFGMTFIDLFTAGLDQNFEEYFTGVTVQQPSGDPRPAFFLRQGPGPIRYNINPDGTSPFVGSNYGSRSASWYDPKMRSPYVMNWNATYQWQFAQSWLLDLSYQGSGGVGLLNAWNINAIHPDISSDRAVLDRIFQNAQPYRPFPHFGTVNLWSNFGHNTFHSGTVKLEKRFSHGLTMTTFYTRSKAINDADNDGGAGGITYYNRRLEKARAGYDLANRSVTYVTYELPFGHGRKWLNSGGAKDWFLGGWNLSWIQTFQSGTPITFTVAGSPNRYLPTVGVRPNLTGTYDNIKVDNWEIGDRFNNNLKNAMWHINAFAYPAAYTTGAAGRNIIEGPGLIWSQTSIAKVLRFAEKVNLDLRFDVNNVFKRPNFSNPSAAANLTAPGLFGKPTGTVGGWCCLGGQFTATFVARLWF